MGKQLAITENGKHIIGKKLFITDNNLIYRKAKKAFLTVGGVHRLVYSSSVMWKKFSSDVETKTESTYTETSYGVGDTTTDSLSLDSDLYRDYSFWEYKGFSGKGSIYKAGNSDGAFADWVVGMYIVYTTEVYKIISLDSENGDVTCEIIAACAEEVVEETIYIQGSTSYGTIEADEGALPESGTLIDGSVEEGHCVLDIEGVCYYYVVDTTEVLQPTASNFTLSDESILTTKDGKIFITQ